MAKVQKANFTGGSLLVRESRIVAKLLLKQQGRSEVLQHVLEGNLFQNNSKATTQKYCQLILSRLAHLTDDQLHFVGSGPDDISRLTLLVAVLKTYPIIADFIEEVVVEKVRCFEPHLEKNDWAQFLEIRAKGDPEVNALTETTQRKMGEVVIRMLAEAGFIERTRTLTILFPALPKELKNSLQVSGDNRLLACMRLGR